MIEGTWGTILQFFVCPTLHVIDELPYLPLPAEAARTLFLAINVRYPKSSIVISTNRPVRAGGENLGDTTVTAAMLDLLVHRSVVQTLDGGPKRLRNHDAQPSSFAASRVRTSARDLGSLDAQD